METSIMKSRIHVELNENGSYNINSTGIMLAHCLPRIDNIAPTKVNVILQSEEQNTVRYTFEKCDLLLSFKFKEDKININCKLENITAENIGKVSMFTNSCVEGCEKILAHGYFSWDQSELIDLDNLVSATSHNLTVISNTDENLVLGYLKNDMFFQTFEFNATEKNASLSTDIFLEGKNLAALPELYLGEMLVFKHKDLFLGQKEWAREVAEINNIKLEAPDIRGWCSWYYDYFWFNGDDIETYMKEFEPFKQDLNLNYFVMDANYFAHLGDWLETCERFPEGLEYYAKLIADNGYVPGIWIGPWMVGDRSKVYKEHKEWLCKDENGNLIEFMSPLGEDNVWAYRDKIHYCLDTSHPEAFEYLRTVFKTLYNWGFRYFKTDFMYWGSMDRYEGGWYNEGVNSHNFIKNRDEQTRIKRHTPGKTRVEYFVDVVNMIKEEVGQDSVILGCGQPIFMSIGYVDCMRISRDVGARWVAHNSPKELLNDLQLRNFMNGIFFHVDPDCALLRHFEHKLTDDELTSLALYMGISQGMIMTSDPIQKCLPERLELFKFIQSENTKIDFRPPLLGKIDDMIVYVGYRKDSDLRVLFCFNNSEVPINRSLSFDDLDLPQSNYMIKWGNDENGNLIENHIQIILDPHQSSLYFLKETEFDKNYKPSRISG